MKEKKEKKEKKESRGTKFFAFVRFGLSEEETAMLDKACKLDERSRRDFARIACNRFASEVVNRYGAGEVISMIKSAISEANDVSPNESLEVARSKN